MTQARNELLDGALREASDAVFHYTSATGLLSIVEKGMLWASDASSLNDLAEVRKGWKAISELLLRLPDSEGRRLLIELASGPTKASHEVFVLSASTAGDDANQWRLYADQGRGYNVELDGQVQLAAVTDVAAVAPIKSRSLGRMVQRAVDSVEVTPWLHVLYSEDEILATLQTVLSNVDSGVAYVDRTVEDDAAEGQFAGELLRDAAAEALAAIAHLIKTPGFMGENEVRVVATFDIGNQHILYRAGMNGVTGYIRLTQAPDDYNGSVLRLKFDGPVEAALPLRGVRVGPLLSEEHPETIKGFLRHSGLIPEVEVSRSAIPLR